MAHHPQLTSSLGGQGDQNLRGEKRPESGKTSVTSDIRKKKVRIRTDSPAPMLMLSRATGDLGRSTRRAGEKNVWLLDWV